LESDGGAGLDGDGDIGDSIGITITQGSTVGGITPGAGRSTTGARMLAVDLPVAVVSTAAEPDHLMETGRRRGDMLHRVARAECAPAPSAATTVAEKPGASPRVEAPALVAGSMAAEGSTEAEAAGEGKRTRDAFE
jgi:hypothetical protein